MAGTKKKYRLTADRSHVVTSKPGEPFTYKALEKGDELELDAEQAERLLEADAIEEVGSKKRAAARAGAQTTAPKGKAEGVGEGDEAEGSIGDGGPDPQGTGSTSTDEQTAGPGDGQGSADAPASSGRKS